MGQAMNITVKITAAESPFSNGLVERHNFIKHLKNHNLVLILPYPGAKKVNAKNSLANVFHLSNWP